LEHPAKFLKRCYNVFTIGLTMMYKGDNIGRENRLF
jgi:hypothetical protein